MFRRKSDADEVTSTLVDNGVYNISEAHDKGRSRTEDPSPYNFLSAMKYAFILTFSLWWLPIIGPMIAGYVTGRRSGKPWIGVLAASLALLSVALIALILDSGQLGISNGTAALKDWLITAIPVFGPYFQFADQYLSFYLGSIEISTGVHLDLYILTLAFAYIGGAMASQTWQEMGYMSRHGGNNMTVQFHNTPGHKDKTPGLFRTRNDRSPAVKSRGSFDDLHAVSDDEDVRSPIDRGVEKARLNMLTSRSQAKRNVNAMKRGQKQTRSNHAPNRGHGTKGREDEKNQGDWRFL
jgi:hypothetical protein